MHEAEARRSLEERQFEGRFNDWVLERLVRLECPQL